MATAVAQVRGRLALSLRAARRLVASWHEAGRPVQVGGIATDVDGRRRAREELQRFRFLSEHSTDTHFLVNSKARFVYVNRAAGEQLGYAPEELLALGMADIDPLSSAHTVRILFEQAGSSSIPPFESMHRRKDGSTFPVEMSVTLARFDDEPHLFAAARNITDRQQAEARLQDSEARKAAILDTALDCIVTIDHAGRIVEFNPAAERTFGYRREDAAGREMCELIIPPGLRDSHRRGMARYLATGEGRILNRRIELMAMRADGTEFPAELAITPITLDGPPMFTGYLRDITEQKRAKRVLQDSEAHFRLMADNAPAMLWVADHETRRTYLSQKWYEYTGSNPEQGLGFGWTEKVHEDDRTSAETVFFEANERHEACNVDYRLRTRDGDYRWVVDSALPRFDAQGEFQGYVGCVIDVHDRKNYEQALKEADRRKDEFLATLAHELRNPLAPVRNAVQLFRLKGPPEPELQWAREVIDRQVEHLTRLIDDLLDVSRITRNNLVLRKQRVALTDVIDGAVETSRPLIEQCGHELHVTLPPEPVYLNADLIRLAQVFTNLLSNAAKYTERGGHIWLTAERENSEIVVCVRDTGVGIPPETQPRLFELFFQADSSLERSHSGLGIGLSLARRLIELHGGSIHARSEGTGRGSEFVVRLAISAGPAVTAPDKSAGTGAAGTARARRILVVDDNHDSADSLAALLRLTGNDVRTAYDSLTAIASAERFRPEVALLDIGMPQVNGCEAARRLRRQPWGKNMLLIAVTGWGQDEDRRRTAAAGFNAHLVKPVDHDALTRLLDDLPQTAASGAAAN